MALLSLPASAAVRYVNLNNPGPATPYASWATAATNIQDAIDVAVPGEQVLVTNGVYQTGGTVVYGFTNRVAVTKPLTVQSVNGAGATIIRGNSAADIRCVYLTNGATLNGFTLTNGGAGGANASGLAGGGVWCESTDALIDHCILAGNSVAYAGGGGAYQGTLNNCLLSGNYAYYGGGAEASILNNCILKNNTASGNGSGANHSTLNNCLLYGNSASEGFAAGVSTLNNCVIAGNDRGVSVCTVNNSIVYSNGNNSGDNHEDSAFNYCCVTPLPGGDAGNFTNAPLFVNLAGGDFHLQTNSPCINAGNNSFVTTTNDPDGTPRILGLVVDVGAYEFPIPVALNVDFTNVAVGFVVNFTSQVFAGNVSSTLLDFGDGTVLTNLASGVHNWIAPGVYPVTLTAYSDIYPTGISAVVTVHVFAGNYFVSLANTTPVPPYTSWTTAATNIQNAVDTAVAGGTVLVSNGVYSVGGRVAFGAMTNRVVVDKPMTVRSVNGPLVTTIQGFLTNNDSAVRCVYLTNGAALMGFTLTNGSTRNEGDWDREVSGGGVWCESAQAFITNCVFSGNTAPNVGGGVYGGTLVDCIFTNNSSSAGGGAYGSALKNCQFWNNSAGYSGGAVYNSTLMNCSLTGNTGIWGGGANSSTLVNCTLTGNSTHDDSDHTSNGGGASSSTLTNCLISGNTSLTGGGVGDSTLVNCAVNGNQSFGSGGGVSGSTLVNCTVVGNVAGYLGGGINSSAATNCIVYFNTASAGTNYSADSTLVYCDTTPLPGLGANNITSDPLLADLKHISSVSPCRSAGTTTLAGITDIDGDFWLNPPSIGCDEFYSSSATGALAVAISATFTNVATGFASDFTGGISGHATANRWDFGDGTVVSNKVFIPHSWAAAGNYTVTLTVFNTDHPAGVSASVTIFVLQQPVHYVALGNINPVAPFTSWSTAATNIQDAVDAAFANGLVVVSNGVYQTGSRMFGAATNRVVVAKPLAIQSVNGANVTIIDGGNAMRCLYLVSPVTVAGLTLRNGTQANGAGVYCQSAADILSDCILSGNSSPDPFSAGGGASGGVLNRCLITGNSASYGGGGMAYSTLNSCIVSNNTMTAYGGGTFGGTINNCLIINNSADWGGGCVGQSTVNNSILVGNTATSGGGGATFSVFLYNCTLVGNTSPGGAGIDFYTVAENCILYNNNGANYSGPVQLDYCCTTPNPGGAVNFTNAPRFADPVNGDFHLQGNSPCINSGNNLYAPGPTDFDGLARVTGGTVDIGAFEFQTPPSLLAYAWAQQYGLPTDGSADDADSDGDGMKNWSESHARTNPTNAVSVLKMLPPLIDTNLVGVTVSWQSVAGVSYFIQRGTNLASPPAFSTILDNISGQAGMTTWQDETATGDGSLFYRVGVH